MRQPPAYLSRTMMSHGLQEFIPCIDFQHGLCDCVTANQSHISLQHMPHVHSYRVAAGSSIESQA